MRRNKTHFGKGEDTKKSVTKWQPQLSNHNVIPWLSKVGAVFCSWSEEGDPVIQ